MRLVLRPSPTVEITVLSALLARTYHQVVPNFSSCITISSRFKIISFPKVDEITSDQKCAQTEVTIEGKKGIFYGQVDVLTNLASGYGVFVTGTHIHCGKAHESKFTDGKAVKINTNTKERQLFDTYL